MPSAAPAVSEAPAGPPSDAAQPNRRERRAIETRRTIIDTARRLFETNGFAATTVDQIAEQADVAPRTFFRYFPTKETVLFADFDEVRRNMLDGLELRPSDEDPLVSLSHALAEMADEVDRRRADIIWGFTLCAEQNVEGVYERSVIKENSHERIAAFIAERLEVDPETDPRPLTWATAAMAVFGAALRFSNVGHGAQEPGRAVARFDELLDSTARALDVMGSVRPRQ